MDDIIDRARSVLRFMQNASRPDGLVRQGAEAALAAIDALAARVRDLEARLDDAERRALGWECAAKDTGNPGLVLHDARCDDEFCTGRCALAAPEPADGGEE